MEGDPSQPTTTSPVVIPSAADTYYLVCDVGQTPCPAENQHWTLVDPWKPPTPEQVADISHGMFVAFFLPTLAIGFLAWGVRQIVGVIR